MSIFARLFWLVKSTLRVVRVGVNFFASLGEGKLFTFFPQISPNINAIRPCSDIANLCA